MNERSAEEFALGLKRAREALSAGPIETLAYVMNEDVESIRDVAGEIESDLFKPRSLTKES